MLGTAGAPVKSCVVKLKLDSSGNDTHPIQIDLDLSSGNSGNLGTLYMTTGEAAHLANALKVAIGPLTYTSSNIVKA